MFKFVNEFLNLHYSKRIIKVHDFLFPKEHISLKKDILKYLKFKQFEIGSWFTKFAERFIKNITGL